MARIRINLTKIVQNFHIVQKICQDNKIELAVVTKCCCGDQKIIQYLIEAGMEIIAESQPKNLQGIGSKVKKIMLHSSLSSLEKKFICDFIYIADQEILKKYCRSSLSKQSQVIIPIELGDMRDGILPNEIIPFLKEAAITKNVRIAGFSANFGCFKANEPTMNWFNSFIECVKEVEYQVGFKPILLSIGGTVILNLLRNDICPAEINQLRIGTGIFLGYDPTLEVEIPYLNQDTFILEGEILEINNNKNNDFYQKRAIIDFGYASASLAIGLRSVLQGVEIIGLSQDVTIVDITNTNVPLFIGDSIEFFLTYHPLIRAMISPYVDKVYVF